VRVGIGVKVRVRTGVGALVLVKVGIIIAASVGVAEPVGLGVLDGRLVAVGVLVGNGILVSKDAPGVRKLFCQIGLVRMAGSRGAKKSTGRLVRKSMLGLRFDPILEFSFQLGAKRSAQPLAKMMQMNPNNRIRRMIIPESRLSFSRVFMETSVYGETHIDGGAGVGLFVMTCTFQPDTSVMRVDDAA